MKKLNRNYLSNNKQNINVFVTGGARSGKSSFAELFAEELIKNIPEATIAYVATGVPLDEEFKERIALHQKRRGESYRLFEEPEYPNNVLEDANGSQVLLFECLPTWLSNLFYYTEKNSPHFNESELYYSIENKFLSGISDLMGIPIERLKDRANCSIQDCFAEKGATQLVLLPKIVSTLKKKIKKNRASVKVRILVTNEIGLGIVPGDKLSRQFRDLLGYGNRLIASSADLAIFSVAGTPQILHSNGFVK